MNLKRVFRYLRKPYFIENRESLSATQFAKYTLIFTFIVSALKIANAASKHFYYEHIGTSNEIDFLHMLVGNDLSKLMVYLLSYVMFMSVIEELTYRLPLSLKKIHIGVSCIVIIVAAMFATIPFIVGSGNSDVKELFHVLTPSLAMLAIMLSILVLSIFRKNLLIKYYHILFFLFPSIYVIVELNHYISKGLDVMNIIFAPQIIISAFIIGIIASYLRVRYKRGISMALCFQAISSAIVVILQYVVGEMME